MKKVKKNLFGMGLALSMMLGMVFALIPQEAEANIIDRGEWTEWYGGYSTPQKMVCCEDWWVDECIVGDSKALPTTNY